MNDYVAYIPVCLAVIGVAWAIKKIKPIILQVFIAFIASISISTFLAFIPEWIHPSTPGENALSWTLVLAATYAIVAVPVSLVAMIVFNLFQSSGQRDNNKQEDAQK
jgi:predicted PurR-regulated permease PerM